VTTPTEPAVGIEVTDVLVVSKTHLDIGFTDLAADVTRRYLEDLLPSALATARTLRAQADGPRLVWTVGSWLVTEALESADPELVASVERAVADGDLAWHAWPFTTHTSLLDRRLADAAVAMSHRLDRRFGRTTVAAKMTDVPGHTRALVPVLAGAGVRLLHLGVNPASTAPDVPPVFRWRDEHTATEVVVLLQPGGYGGGAVLPGTTTLLVVDHTGDNLGPPTVDAVRALHATLTARHPQATIRAGRLDDAWDALDAGGGVDELPDIRAEIGDTWIHGAASDPAKVARFRAVARAVATAVEAEVVDATDPAVVRADRNLLLVAEHTWGLDEKTAWPDTTTYAPDDVAVARTADPRVARFEASWAEQRSYVDRAVAALAGTGLAAPVAAELRACEPEPPDVAGLAPSAAGSPIRGRHLTITIDPVTGAVIGCTTADGRALAGRSHPLARFVHQTFSVTDYERWWEQYVVAAPEDEWWAFHDQTKPGMEVAAPPSRRWQPTLVSLHVGWVDGGVRAVARLAGPAVAVDRHGCPADVWLTYDLPDDAEELRVDVSWSARRASRLPEALWCTFHPRVADPSGWRLDVLGQAVSPFDVVPDGARSLHAVGRGVANLSVDEPLHIVTLDAPVVAVGPPRLLRHDRDLVPDVAGRGLAWCLYDNVWGTNFPMWSDEPGRARFVVRPVAPPWWT